MKNNSSNTKVYPISISGQKGVEIPVTEKALNLMNQKTFVFEVVTK